MIASKTQIESEIYRRSFYEFSLESFKVLHNGQELIQNWHIEYLCNKVQSRVERVLNNQDRTKHLLINVPPRTLKSELVNVFLSAWIWSLRDDLQLISSSYSASLSLTLSVQARRLIESDWYRTHFPNVSISKDQNTKTKFTTPNGGLRYSTSTGGTVTGMGADIIVVDDPQNPQLARSDVERENSNTFFNETLRSRLNDPLNGLFIVIMQRLHEDDLTGMLLSLEPNEWEHICLPSEESNNIKPLDLRHNYIDGLLFPQRLSKKVLESFKIGLGSYGYSGQYGQLPSPQDGGILKAKWFNIIDSVLDGNGNILDLNSLKWDFFFDTAYTTKQSNDPSALLACTFYNNNIYIRKVSTVRMEFPELVKEIPKFCFDNGYTSSSMAYVEPKASGKSIVQQLRKITALNIIEGKNPEADKVSRVNGISPVIESGRCYLISGGWNDAFLNECNAFPNGLHDDMVDVLVMAIDELSRGGDFIFI